MDHIDEIKARLPIEVLVAQYVTLKRVGRQFKALCPFHKERTPSFIVSPERQLAYCFGCHKGGDQFKFIQEMEGLDFRGALTLLAEKTGIQLPKVSPEYKQRATERDRLVEVHETATDFFENALEKSDAGKKAKNYLKKRGIKDEMIQRARLGYAPGAGDEQDDRDALTQHLLEKGFTRSEIVTAGVAVSRDTHGSSCVDRFRNRLMFPIYNLAGNICAFGGRALNDNDQPKYLNSPETPIYHKSSLLYGLSQARAAIRNEKTVVLVEGYMDALTAQQAGFENTVASSGTALTDDQLAALKRFTTNVIFALDQDTAGKLATIRAIELALAQNFIVRVAQWDPAIKDPDECIQKNPALFSEALKNALPATEFLLKHFAAEHDVKTAQGKHKIISELLPFFKATASPLELDEWLKSCAAFLDLSLDSLYDEVKRFQGTQKYIVNSARNRGNSADDDKTKNVSFSISPQEYLIGLLLTHKDTLGLVNHIVTPEQFEDLELQNIYRSLTSEYNQSLDEKESQRANILALFVESAVGELPAAAIKEEVLTTLNSLLRQKFDREKRALIKKLKEVPEIEKSELLEEYQQLLARDAHHYGKET